MELLELILYVIILGLVVNLLANMIWKYLPGTDKHIDIFVSIALILICILLVIYTKRDQSKKNSEPVNSEVISKSTDIGKLEIIPIWTDIIDFKGTLGEAIKKKLENFQGPATWYFVTISPRGFEPWIQRIKDTYTDQNINIKWVYDSPESLKKGNEGNRRIMEMLYSDIPNWELRGDSGIKQIEDMRNLFESYASDSDKKLKNKLPPIEYNRAGTWEFYESDMPHFFMAFLSVPGELNSNNFYEEAPPGTFGFVHLYVMFPKDYKSRCAIYFEAPNPILDVYFRTIIDIFSEGLRRGYVKRVWSSNTSNIN